MRSFYTWIVNHTKTVITVFVLTAAFCALLQTMVGVNYDMNDYLPEDSPSTVSLDTMEAEFDGGIPNARVMIRDVTVPQALNYKKQLQEVDGVTDVMWLDDAVDIHQPLDTLERDTVEAYCKDSAALFTVTIEEDARSSATAEIRSIIGEENAMTGDAVSTAVATASTVSEIKKIAAFAVLFVLLVLALTTTSWMEPIVVLLGLGVAVLINSGTNLIFGEISFVTNAAGNILQIAVSLDYSVFLIHRFEECRETQSDPRQAMVDALCRSTGSILSSGLTTVIGFLALVFMRFQIGPDLGLALAKGVAISLLTVFTFMPSLIITCYRWMDKLHHRSFMPDFSGFGRVVTKLMLPAVCIFAIMVVPSYLASNSNSFYYGSSHIFGPATQLGSDTEDIEEVFGQQDTYVLLVPQGNSAREKALSDTLQELPQIESIISFVDAAGPEVPQEYLDADTLSQLESAHYSRMVLTVDTAYEGQETFDLVKSLREIAQSYYPDEYLLAGAGVSTYDLMDTITTDMMKVNLIAIGAVFLVLLLTLRNVILPVILVLCIETAIWINLAIPYFSDYTVFCISYLIISAVQLGATVDYAILFTDRYRECRQTMDKKEAVVHTIAAVLVSVMTSATVLAVVGFLLGFISSHGILAQLGMFLGRGSLLSLCIVLLVLPGFLYLLDGLVTKQRKARISEEVSCT